ncbi:MAG: heavy metal efflux pump, CzcA family, partial [Chlorobi bacterium OLB5]
TVQIGGDTRRGLLDMNGEGEVVGGIIVMRYGENASDVIERVKEKLAELEKGLPDGVKIETSYDRSDLIHNAINTLKDSLIEEAIVVSLIVMIFFISLAERYQNYNRNSCFDPYCIYSDETV